VFTEYSSPEASNQHERPDPLADDPGPLVPAAYADPSLATVTAAESTALTASADSGSLAEMPMTVDETWPQNQEADVDDPGAVGGIVPVVARDGRWTTAELEEGTATILPGTANPTPVHQVRTHRQAEAAAVQAAHPSPALEARVAASPASWLASDAVGFASPTNKYPEDSSPETSSSDPDVPATPHPDTPTTPGGGRDGGDRGNDGTTDGFSEGEEGGEGEEDRRVRLATAARSNYELQFRVTVPAVVREVRAMGPNAGTHPNTVGVERERPDSPANLLVRVEAAEEFDEFDEPAPRGCIVRIPHPGEPAYDHDQEERARAIALLDGPSREGTQYGITEELVAYNPEYHSVTRFVRDTAAGDEPRWERIESPDCAIYLLRNTGVNMPKLQRMTADRDPQPWPMEPATERAIIQRAQRLIQAPYGQDLSLAPRDVAVMRGIMEGVSDEQLARRFRQHITTIGNVTRRLRERFGAETREALLYSVLAHGVNLGELAPGVDLGGVDVSASPTAAKLTETEALHFYLACTGWDQTAAAKLLGLQGTSVADVRVAIMAKFGASGRQAYAGMTQAIVAAFANGYLVPFQSEGEHVGLINPGRQAYVARTYATNMPRLGLSRTGTAADANREPLTLDGQRQIRMKAREMIETPQGQPLHFTPDEMAVLRGYAQGHTNQVEVAVDMQISPRTVGRLVSGLHERFGTSDPAALMYSVLLHGVDLGTQVDERMRKPNLTHNQQLQFYLACLGYDEVDAARLVGRTADTVQDQLSEVRKGFGGVPMPRAIALAFKLGHFKPIPEDLRQAAQVLDH
jgi:DNA-binding NarL/FixJ family response regulator